MVPPVSLVQEVSSAWQHPRKSASLVLPAQCLGLGKCFLIPVPTFSKSFRTQWHMFIWSLLSFPHCYIIWGTKAYYFCATSQPHSADSHEDRMTRRTGRQERQWGRRGHGKTRGAGRREARQEHMLDNGKVTSSHKRSQTLKLTQAKTVWASVIMINFRSYSFENRNLWIPNL